MERFITQHLSKLVLGFCMLIAVNACKKNDATPTFAGKYTGKLIYGEGGVVYNHGVALADITLTQDAYTATNVSISPTGYSAPVTTTGTYQFRADSITFAAAVTPPGNGQNSILSLTGNYQQHFEGDSLILTKQYRLGELSVFSQYRLKRN
ncbi:MAG: hypothetical protein ABIN91_11795 [Mucilaginibacter sp.]|uniref:hypothetical protein n=1 Tax=Mucilaginibacter sp. TaxID=1882438 RepID=UPI0032638E08